MKSVLLVLIIMMISCASDDGSVQLPFKFEAIDKWILKSIENENDDESINKYKFINSDEIEMVISVNENLNELIMCFCAPIDQYEIVKHENYTTYQWPKTTDQMYEKFFTMKWQGINKSLDVHFVFDDENGTRDKMMELFKTIEIVEK